MNDSAKNSARQGRSSTHEKPEAKKETETSINRTPKSSINQPGKIFVNRTAPKIMNLNARITEPKRGPAFSNLLQQRLDWKKEEDSSSPKIFQVNSPKQIRAEQPLQVKREAVGSNDQLDSNIADFHNSTLFSKKALISTKQERSALQKQAGL